MLVLAATLIVGNIIADLLLAVARSARPPRRERRNDRARRYRRADARQGRPRPALATPVPGRVAKGRFAHGNESYSRAGLAPVPPLGHGHDRPGARRRCSWSWRSSRDFFAPMDPKRAGPRLRAARRTSASAAPTAASRSSRCVYPIVETGEFDPVTFQPLTGPDYDNPTDARLLRQGPPATSSSGSSRPTFTSSARSTAARSISSAPTSSAATSSRAASSARGSR